MSRYTELGEELDLVLEEKRRLSTDKYGMVSAEGKREEWQRMEQRAAEIRKQMREARYGKGTE